MWHCFEEKWGSILKLDIVLKENDSLKNKIISISKKLDLASKDNKTLKNDLDSHVCHALSSSVSIAGSTLSSTIKNDICVLKKSVDCLGSTLSQCAMNHTRLDSIFRKKQVSHMHAHHTRHTHASHAHTHDTMYVMCTLAHIVDVRATLQNFVMID